MARKRGGSRKERGKSRTIPKSSHPQRNLLPGDLEEHDHIAIPRLSLVDVARNTERHRDGNPRRQEDTGLQFVRGGMLEGSLELKSTPLHKDSGAPIEAPTSGLRRPDPIVPRKSAFSPPCGMTFDHASSHSTHDGGQESILHGQLKDASSDSEDDVIIFQGRGAQKRQQPHQNRPASHIHAAKHRSHVTSASAGNLVSDGAQSSRRATDSRRSSRQDYSKHGSTVGRRSRSPRGLQSKQHLETVSAMETSEDDEAIQDYITNVIAHELNVSDDSWLHSEADDVSMNNGSDHMLAPSPRSLEPTSARTPAHDHMDDPRQNTRLCASDMERSISADTADQATHDLQIVFDEPDPREQEHLRAILDPTNSSQIANIRGDRGSTSLEMMPFEAKNGSDEISSDVSTDHLERQVSQMLRTSRTSKVGRSQIEADPSFISGIKGDRRNVFDVTDRSRKSIGGYPRTNYAHVKLELSDSELERSLFESWNRDKAKKRHRKKEREEARAKGLIGGRRKGQLTDASALREVGWETLTAQIKAFLLSNRESLTLAPMDKRSRRVVHEFAIALNLKSKSIGGGEKRFPTLTRTPRTVNVSGALFEAVEARLSRRFTVGMAKQFRDEPTGKGPRYGKSSFAAASYRDGEVVGAAAPEIGLDNRGRAMLEKMGWSSGTALGAANNKGILLPVAHTVKNSKLGLG